MQGPRDVQIRAGIKPPNHAKSNISAVKEQSSLNALRKLAQQQENANPRGGAAMRPSAERSTSAPSKRAQRTSNEGGGRDFLQENRMGAAAPVRLPRINSGPKDDGSKYLNKPDYGRVGGALFSSCLT